MNQYQRPNMKNVLLLLAILTITNVAFAQNHKVYCKETSCKPKGLLVEEGTIKKGKKEGYWKDYYACVTGHRLHEEGNYENDKKVGIWKNYSPYNYLTRITPFVNGLENGEETSYHESGEISGKSTYLNGKLVGESKRFYENGKIKSLYYPNTGESKSYYLNGQLESIGFFNPIDYEKVGEWKEYYENGRLKKIGNYKGTDRIVVLKEYFDNGTLKSVGELKGDSRIGIWKIYHNNGQLSGTGQYKKDGWPLENSWTTYDRNGQRDSVDCPEPTDEQIQWLCYLVAQKKTYEGPYKFGYEYTEALWQMAAANPAEYLPALQVMQNKVAVNEIAGYQKVIRMWNKYNIKFICNKDVTSAALGKNILKYAVERADVLVKELIKVYHADINFIDPSDGKTLLDFVQDRIEYFKNDRPVPEVTLDSYQKLYAYFRKNGAKHAREL